MQKTIHNSLSCTHFIVHSTLSFFFPVTPLLPRAYLQTGRHGKSNRTSRNHIAQIASLSSQLPPFISATVMLTLLLCCPQLSHLLGCHSASAHLAFIRIDAHRYASAAHMAANQTHFHFHVHTHPQYVNIYIFIYIFFYIYINILA